MNQALMWGAVVVIVAVIVVGGGWWLLQNNAEAPTITPTAENVPGQTGGTQNNPNFTNGGGVNVGLETSTPKTHTVTYTNSGYSPSALTVKKGDTVTFKNQSSGELWTGSAMHPTHMAYSGTTLQQHCPDPENNDFDQCKAEGAGASWSFTFTKTGSFGYHNHVNTTHFGKVTVE
ncbi:MAG TPA: hypothetical protein VI937_02700 [Negativicutes bacterium]|nr:hypothetical protein [Negativicutes bacterium]